MTGFDSLFPGPDAHKVRYYPAGWQANPAAPARTVTKAAAPARTAAKTTTAPPQPRRQVIDHGHIIGAGSCYQEILSLWVQLAAVELAGRVLTWCVADLGLRQRPALHWVDEPQRMAAWAAVRAEQEGLPLHRRARPVLGWALEGSGIWLLARTTFADLVQSVAHEARHYQQYQSRAFDLDDARAAEVDAARYADTVKVQGLDGRRHCRPIYG